MYLTPADLLSRGLNLPALSTPAQPVPPGTCCAITGQPITAGYPVADVVTDATAEFLDCFRGGVHGWVSEAAARCFKSADPRRGNPCARSHLVFADGTYYGPLIDRLAEPKAREAAAKAEQALAAAEAAGADGATLEKLRVAAQKARARLEAVAGRPVWSDLVRQVWPMRAGQQCLVVLTTDTKKRLWIRARVGALGSRTPVLVYDAGLAIDQVRLLDWPALIECLDLVEEVYGAGFPKQAIGESLYGQTTAIEQVGLRRTGAWERLLRDWRPRPEFAVALLIAQKREAQEEGDLSCQLSLL